MAGLRLNLESLTGKCECEHSSHFDDGTGHKHGSEERFVCDVQTVYGIMRQCALCRAKRHGII